MQKMITCECKINDTQEMSTSDSEIEDESVEIQKLAEMARSNINFNY